MTNKTLINFILRAPSLATIGNSIRFLFNALFWVSLSVAVVVAISMHISFREPHSRWNFHRVSHFGWCVRFEFQSIVCLGFCSSIELFFCCSPLFCSFIWFVTKFNTLPSSFAKAIAAAYKCIQSDNALLTWMDEPDWERVINGHKDYIGFTTCSATMLIAANRPSLTAAAAVADFFLLTITVIILIMCDGVRDE